MYLKACDNLKTRPHAHVLKSVATYLTDLLRLFGVIVAPQTLGFPVGEQQQALEDKVMPDLLRFADLRERIRRKALEGKSTFRSCAGPSSCLWWLFPDPLTLLARISQTQSCSRPATVSGTTSCPILASASRTRRTVRRGSALLRQELRQRPFLDLDATGR